MALDPRELLDKALKLPLAARVGILLAVYVLIVSLYYVGFHTDKEKELESKQANFQQLHAKLVQTQKIASEIDIFIDEVEQLKDRLAQAQDQLPPEAKMDVLIEQITRIGKDNGLKFSKITPGKETPQNFYYEIPISFDMEGKYHAFGLFFSEVASQTRIMNVSDLKLNRAQSESSVLKASFGVTTYRSREVKPGAEAAEEAKAPQKGKAPKK